MFIGCGFATNYLASWPQSKFHYSLFLLLGDPLEFLSWLLNTLHYALCAGKRKGKSIVQDTFQGEMKIRTRKLLPQIDVS